MEIKEVSFQSEGRRLIVKTPYHPEAVQAFRNLMGKWDGYNR